MNKKSSNKIKPETKVPKMEQKSQRLNSFDIEVSLGSTVTPDPFAMPSIDDGSVAAYFSRWDTLESKQHFFDPPHPLAYGGNLNNDWHRFLRGALSPFIEAFGILSPIAGGWTPNWAVKAARKCMEAMNCATPTGQPYSVGWCLGFGIAAAKKFDDWGVVLKEHAKASPELKQYLFSQVADRVERETEIMCLFLKGFCDGSKAGQEIDSKTHNFKWQLFVALKWAELERLSRVAAAGRIREAVKTKSDTRNEERQILKFLAGIDFPKAVLDSSKNAKTP